MLTDAPIGIAGPISLPLLRPYLPAEADAPSGMGGTPVTHLVRGLVEQGRRVSVYTLDPAVASAHVLRGDRLVVYVGPFRRRGRMRDFMRRERHWIRRFVQQDAPALVHAHWTYEYALGALATRRPTIVTVHDWAPTIFAQWRDAYRLGRLLMNAVTLWKGTHFIANSPYIQARLERWVTGPVTVVPNALDDDRFSPPSRPGPGTPPTLISINNGFGARKNVTTLLRAFASVRRAHPDSRLRLVGERYGPGQTAEAWARERGLAAGVVFVGPLAYEDTLDELRAADLLVHPALEESFGMTLLEAMATGTPVVAGAESGAVPWVTGEGTAAMLTDVTQPAALANAVETMLTDPERWRALAAAGYEHAWTHFRLSAVVAQHLDAYTTLLQSTQPDASVPTTLSSP